MDVLKSTLSSIASATRTKTGGSELLKPAQIAGQIEGLNTVASKRLFTFGTENITLPVSERAIGATYLDPKFYVAGYNELYLYTSEDLVTWTKSTSELPFTPSWVRAFNRRLFIGDLTQIAHSDDQGETWSEPVTYPVPCGTVIAPACSSDGYMMLGVGNATKFNISMDFGETWEERNTNYDTKASGQVIYDKTRGNFLAKESAVYYEWTLPDFTSSKSANNISGNVVIPLSKTLYLREMLSEMARGDSIGGPWHPLNISNFTVSHTNCELDGHLIIPNGLYISAVNLETYSMDVHQLVTATDANMNSEFLLASNKVDRALLCSQTDTTAQIIRPLYQLDAIIKSAQVGLSEV